MPSAVHQAAEVLGENPRHNLRLEPELHAQRLPSEAGPLRRILESAEIKHLIARYRAYGRAAVESQSSYWRTCKVILIIIALGVVVGGVVVVAPLPVEYTAAARLVASAAVYTALIVPLYLAWRLSRARHYEQWNENRAAAEHLRRRFFEQVLRAPAEAKPGELPALQLKLEHFRRYQFDLQENYHDIRSADYSRRAERANRLLLPSITIALVWIIIVFLGTASAWAEQGMVPTYLQFFVHTFSGLQAVEIYHLDSWALMLGILMTSAYGFLFLRTIMDRNLRNLARHATARANFSFLRKTELQAAREAAARGDESQALRFVDHVHSIMSAEVADWVRLQELELGRDVLTG